VGLDICALLMPSTFRLVSKRTIGERSSTPISAFRGGG
jgi:hypothetical protein